MVRVTWLTLRGVQLSWFGDQFVPATNHKVIDVYGPENHDTWLTRLFNKKVPDVPDVPKKVRIPYKIYLGLLILIRPADVPIT